MIIFIVMHLKMQITFLYFCYLMIWFYLFIIKKVKIVPFCSRTSHLFYRQVHSHASHVTQTYV